MAFFRKSWLPFLTAKISVWGVPLLQGPECETNANETSRVAKEKLQFPWYRYNEKPFHACIRGDSSKCVLEQTLWHGGGMALYVYGIKNYKWT